MYTHLRTVTVILILVSLMWLSACSHKGDRSQSDELPVFIADSDPVITQSLPDEPEPVTFTPDLIYNEEGELMMGNEPGPAAVDDSGRFLVVDPGQSTVHVFEVDGEYRGALGGDGDGPGEFSHIADLAVSGDTVHVLDAVKSRISLYRTQSMKHIRDRSVALAESETEPGWMIRKQREGLHYRPLQFFIKDNGNYLVASADEGMGTQDNLEHRTYEFSIFDTEAETYIRHDMLSLPWTGRVLVHRERETTVVMFDVPFIRTTVFGFDGENIVAGWTGDLALNVYEGSGEIKHGLYYLLENTPMRWGDAESWYREVLVQRNAGERVYRELLAETPENWPAFHSLIMDDRSRAWVALIGEDRGSFDWIVIDTDTGDIEKGITLPRYVEILSIRNGFLYIREQQDEMKPTRYVRYRYD